MKMIAIATALSLTLAACGDTGIVDDPVVKEASTTIKGSLCTAGVALAASAAAKRGIPVEAVIGTDILIAGCKSLADRLPVSRAVYDRGIDKACADFNAYARRIADQPDQLSVLRGIQADAGCA